MESYLQNIPEKAASCGISKVLMVRREIIHIKHIFTEAFHRKTIPLEAWLEKLDMSLYEYMTYMTQRIRRLHKISRNFTPNPNEVVHFDYVSFFPQIEFLQQAFKVELILDFDGVVTNKFFRTSGLYDLCVNRVRTSICSANPEVSIQRFDKYQIQHPTKIFANKGKVKKIKTLIRLASSNDFTFFVDDETTYLELAWIFGIKTFHYQNKVIRNFSLSSK